MAWREETGQVARLGLSGGQETIPGGMGGKGWIRRQQGLCEEEA